MSWYRYCAKPMSTRDTRDELASGEAIAEASERDGTVEDESDRVRTGGGSGEVPDGQIAGELFRGEMSGHGLLLIERGGGVR